MKLIITFFLILNCLSIHAQDTVYARKVLNTLCSKKFAGRGYVHHGDRKAAGFIRKEFRSIGLNKVNGTFQQKFSFPVNTFPKKVSIKYNGRLLEAGKDYIINAGCRDFKYSGPVTFVSVNDMSDSSYYDRLGYHQTMAILDTFNKKYFTEAEITSKKYLKDYRKELLIRLTSEKMTWTTSYEQENNCMITLKDYVFDRTKPASFEIIIDSKFYNPYSSQNILGMIEGTKNKDSFIVFTAHYDHLGMMGNKAMFPGANDNASGIAMMLSLAKYFQSHPQKYSLLFIAFSGEEAGLIGSQYFVKNPLIPLNNVHFLINIDLMGNGADGVMAVNGTIFKEQFRLLTDINSKYHYLPAVKSRGKAANSDHYYFSEAGVPCFFFYLMGPYPFYHDVFDQASAVPFTNFGNAFSLFRDFIIALQ